MNSKINLGFMKYAIVTGASTGLGKEFSLKLAELGYSLVLVARNESKLNALAKEIKKTYGMECKAIPLDLAKNGSAEKLFKETKKLKLQIEVLVNNAGYGLNGEFHKNNFLEEAEMVRLNVNSLAELCHLYLPGMVESKKGYILNVASTAAFQPGPYMSNYYATKAYVLSLSEGLSEEVKKYGVSVSCLCPGPTRTEFFERAQMTKSKLINSPLLAMEAREVVSIGIQALFQNKPVKISGFINFLLAQSVRITPRFLIRKIAAYLNKIN